MSETEEVTVLIDLDRIPEGIGYTRKHNNSKGVYNHRIYMDEDYDKIYNWIVDQLGNLQDVRLNIQGNLPNWIMMGLAIDLTDDPRVFSVYHSKFGDRPTEIWNAEHGVVL
jgi:hypothetical protein